ncbi:MAG TPA: sialidase family protein [Frankiaceae bacterium]|nr:sialidase family protein [Frankiaceae bacterium]
MTSAPEPAAAAAPPMCQDIVVSPAYRRDRTVFCVHRGTPDARRVLAVSVNGGRTWRDAALTGLLRPAGVSGIALTLSVSPAFGTDRTLFVTTGSGTFLSTDLGQSFRLVDALTKPHTDGNPVPFVGRLSALPLGDTAPRLLLAYAGTQVPALIDPGDGSRRPATGVPGRGALQFVVRASATAPDGALAIVNEPDGPADHAVVYRCDGSLTCAVPSFAFPSGTRFALHSRVRLLPDGSLVAVLSKGGAADTVWRSTDGGATFAVWAPVARLLDAAERAGGDRPVVTLASTHGLPRRLYARVEVASPATRWRPGAPPASQLFRSDDGGATWRRIGYGRAMFQPGPHGNLPWAGDGQPGEIELAPDGRLLASGSADSVFTTWCSLDGGKRWYAGCPR